MKPGSLPRLSEAAEALLRAEREIVPQPDLVRRRAELRARTALWHMRQPPSTGSRAVALFRRFRVVAIAALVTSGAAAWMALSPPPQADAPVIIPMDQAPSTQAEKVRKPMPAPEPEVADEAPEEPSAPAPHEAARRPKKPSVSQGTKPAPQEEFVLLDRARRAVASGSYQVALNHINKHKRTFPNSQLGEERAALRVRALEGVGQLEQAKKASSDFKARYPKSVLAPQMNSGQDQ